MAADYDLAMWKTKQGKNWQEVCKIRHKLYKHEDKN